MRGVLVVAGRAGHGQDGGGAHRAAYLLYAHQFPARQPGGPCGWTRTRCSAGTSATYCPAWARPACAWLDAGRVGVSAGGIGDGVRPSGGGGGKADPDLADRLLQVVRSHQRPWSEVAHVGYCHPSVGAHAGRQRPPGGLRRAPKRPTGPVGPSSKASCLSTCGGASQRLIGAPPARDWPRPPTAEAEEVIDRLRHRGRCASPRRPDVARVDSRSRRARGAGWPLGIHPSSGWSEHDLAPAGRSGRPDRPARYRQASPAATDRPGPDETMDRTLASLGLLPECPSCGSELSLSAEPLGSASTPPAGRPGGPSRSCHPRRSAGAGDHGAGDRRPLTKPSPAKPPHRDLRPCHRRRSPGSDADAMAHARPALPHRVDDPGRRPRPGQAFPWSARSWSAVCGQAAPHVPHQVFDLGRQLLRRPRRR